MWGAGVAPEIGFRPESLTFTVLSGEGNPATQTFQVFTLRNRSVLRFTISTDSLWLRVVPVEGISVTTNDREQITVSVLTSDLDPGTFEGLITVSARRARNDPQTVPVTLVILSAPQPGVISEASAVIDNSEATEIVTPDNRVQVIIPQGALPEEAGDDVEVEVKNVDVASVPMRPAILCSFAP